MAITTTNVTASTKIATSRTHSNSNIILNDNNNMLTPTNSNIDFTTNTSGNMSVINDNSNLIDNDTNNNNNNKKNDDNENITNDNGHLNNDNNNHENHDTSTTSSSSIDNAHSPGTTTTSTSSTNTSVSNGKPTNITTTTAKSNNVMSTRHKFSLHSHSYQQMNNNNHREANHYNNHHSYLNSRHYNNQHHHLNHQNSYHHHNHHNNNNNYNHHYNNHQHGHSKHSNNNNIPKHKIAPLTWSSYSGPNPNNNNNNSIVNTNESSQPTQQANNPSTQPNNQPVQPIGPPYFVELHVNPGQCVSLQLLDGREQIVAGPATITMVSQQPTPPVPIPVQVPLGHMIHQIADENGTLKHIVLSVMTNEDDSNPSDNPAFITLPQGSFRIDSHGELVCVNPNLSTISQDTNGFGGQNMLSQQAYYSNYNGYPYDYVPTSPMMMAEPQFDSTNLTTTSNQTKLSQPATQVSFDTSPQATSLYYNHNQNNHHQHQHHYTNNTHNHHQHNNFGNGGHHQTHQSANYLHNNGPQAYSSVVSSGSRQTHNHEKGHYYNDVVNSASTDACLSSQFTSSDSQVVDYVEPSIEARRLDVPDSTVAQEPRISNVVRDKERITSIRGDEYKSGNERSRPPSGRHLTQQSRDNAFNKQHLHHHQQPQQNNQKLLNRDKNLKKNLSPTKTTSSPKLSPINNCVSKSHSPHRRDNRQGNRSPYPTPTSTTSSPSPSKSTDINPASPLRSSTGSYKSHLDIGQTQQSSPKSVKGKNNSHNDIDARQQCDQSNHVQNDRPRAENSPASKCANQITDKQDLQCPGARVTLTTTSECQSTLTKEASLQETQTTSPRNSRLVDMNVGVGVGGDILPAVIDSSIKQGAKLSDVVDGDTTKKTAPIVQKDDDCQLGNVENARQFSDTKHQIHSNNQKHSNKDRNSKKNASKTTSSPESSQNNTVSKSHSPYRRDSSRQGNRSPHLTITTTTSSKTIISSASPSPSSRTNSVSSSDLLKYASQKTQPDVDDQPNTSQKIVKGKTKIVVSASDKQSEKSPLEPTRSREDRSTSVKHESRSRKSELKKRSESVQLADELEVSTNTLNEDTTPISVVSPSITSGGNLPDKHSGINIIGGVPLKKSPSSSISSQSISNESTSSKAKKKSKHQPDNSNTKQHNSNSKHNNSNNQPHHKQQQQPTTLSSHNTNNNHNSHKPIQQHRQQSKHHPNQQQQQNQLHHVSGNSSNSGSSTASSSLHLSSLVPMSPSTSSGGSTVSHMHHHHGQGGVASSHSKADSNFKLTSYMRQFKTKQLTMMLGRLFHDSVSTYSETKFASFIIMLFSSISLLLAVVIHVFIMRP